MAGALLLAVAALQAPVVPLDEGWELAGEGTRIEAHQGTPAIRIGTGRALRRDVSLQDGTVEFDVALTPRRSFVYVEFRVASDDEYEHIYFRPHKSALPDALQYAPVWRGESNWQLYHGADGTAAFAFDHARWMHVRLVLQGRRAALFLGEDDTPDLLVRLAREPVAGALAFAASVPPGAAGPPGEPVAAFANVVVRPGHVPYRFPPTTDSLPAGLVTTWQLSPAFPGTRGPMRVLPDSLLRARERWPTFRAEPTGVLVVGRHLARPHAVAGTIARLVLRAGAPTLQPLQLGYSDYVTVFVNGRPIFGGDAHYSFDRPRQDGFIGLWQSTLWLPLARGDNEVLFALSDGFGGWGLTARLDPAGGARLVPP